MTGELSPNPSPTHASISWSGIRSSGNASSTAAAVPPRRPARSRRRWRVALARTLVLGEGGIEQVVPTLPRPNASAKSFAGIA